VQQIRQGQQARPSRPRLVPTFRKRGREGRPADPAAQLAPARARSMGLRALSATALALLALATVGAASSAAARTWLSPVDLSANWRGPVAWTPQVAIDSEGDAVAVWTLENGGKGIVQSASRPAGGAWSAPVTLSATAQRLTNPQVAVDPKGDAVAVWSLFDSPNGFTVKSAQRLAGGAWSAPVSLPAAGDFSDPHARLSIDSQGDAVAVWRGPDGIQSARRPAGGAWSTAVSLFGRGHDPEVAVNPRGDAVAVWLRGGEYGVVLRAASYEAAARLQRARAYAAPAAHPEGTTVLVRLRCRGHGSCRGAVKLYFEHELIAKRHFALAAHRSRTLGVKLNRRGRELVHNTHRHRLKLELSGRGVKNRTEVLKGL